ncbi:hypothetical protein D8807_10160 [Streptococcus gordonii]|nr:hypothetical protein D8807_10160 [Streptococcus gordonii]
MARGRQSRGKSLKKNIYIFTEGETEKNYFSILNKKYNSTVNVRVSIQPAHKQGKNLLSHALGRIKALSKVQKRNLEAVYIIFDKDSLDNIEIENVLSEAKENDVKVGFSNSCFEVWLLAHFEKPNSSHTKSRLYEKLEKYLKCNQYSKNHKNDEDLLKQLEDYVSTAINNTSLMQDLSQKVIAFEPYTNIGTVIKNIYHREIY